MTELYNAQWYDTYQNALETNDVRFSPLLLRLYPHFVTPKNFNGCIDAYSTSEHSWGIQPLDVRNCDRSFRMRANMETKIKVKIPPVEEQGRPVFAWAYAPFMDVVPRSWGPMVLLDYFRRRSELRLVL